MHAKDGALGVAVAQVDKSALGDTAAAAAAAAAAADRGCSGWQLDDYNAAVAVGFDDDPSDHSMTHHHRQTTSVQLWRR